MHISFTSNLQAKELAGPEDPNAAEPQSNPNSLTQALSQRERDLKFSQRPCTDIYAQSVDVTMKGSSLIDRAGQAWALRDTKKGTEEAIAFLRAALQEAPDKVEYLVWLAQALYWLGSVHIEDREARIAAFEEGEQVGDRALQLEPSHIGAMHWTASNIGRRAEERGKFATVRALRRIKVLQRKTLEADETFFYGGPHLFWALYYVKAPWPMENFDRACEHFERALEIESRYLRTYELYVEYYLLEKDRDRARNMLEKVRRTPASILPEAAPENKVAKKHCELIYKKHFAPTPDMGEKEN